MKRIQVAVLALVLLVALCVPVLWAGAADTTVQFADPVLEQKIRDCLGWPAGEITAAMAQEADILDLHYEDGEQITDLRGLEYFTGVWLLSLFHNDITDISPLAAMPNLRDLDLGGNRVTDISALAGKDLISLALWENEVSDIEPLRDAWNLEVLDLCNNRVTDISALAGKTKLTYLSLGGNEIADYSPVADFYNTIPEKDFELDSEPMPLREEENSGDVIAFTDPVLEARVRQEIGIPEGDITLETAAVIAGLDLSMPGGTAEEDKIQSIWDLLCFPNLDYLNLCNNCIGDISPLLELTNLRELRIAGNPIWDPSLLGEMTWLTRLEFYANMEEGVPYIVNLTSLVELNTGGVRSLPDDLYKLENLGILRVAGGELADISVLAQMPNLVALDISWNLVEDISALEGLPLTELFLAGNPIADYEPIRGVAFDLYGRDFDPYEIFAVMDEPENPDLVIAFHDAVFERCVRDALGKPEGDITAADAATLTELWHDNDWNAPAEQKVRDITGIKYCVNLRRLGLNFNDVSDISELEGLKKLKDLGLGSNQIADIGALAGMADMESLSIFGNRISDIGPLAHMTKIYYLNANGNLFTDITPLAGMTGMDMLDLSGCNVRDITPLAGMQYLRVLAIANNEISDIGALAGKMNLQELRLENNPIADYSPIADIYPSLTATDFEYWEGRSDALTEPENPERIVAFPDPLLESAVRNALGMSEGDITAGDAARIRGLKLGLEWQEMIPEEIKIKDLTGIEYCINLQTLSLTFHGISDITPLQSLTKLESLDLGGNPLTDIGALAGLTNISELTLFGSGISDLTPLAGMTDMNWLYIPQNAFSDLSPLAGMTGLEGLIVTYNEISDLSPIAGLTRLQLLDFANNYVTDLTPLAGMTELQVLMLNGNPVADYTPIKSLYDTLKDKDFEYGQAFETQTNTAQVLPDNPDEVIVFPDPAMEAAIRDNLKIPTGDIRVKDVFFHEELNIGNYADVPEEAQIHDLTGIEYFHNLRHLEVTNQAIADLTPLAGLVNLNRLDIYGNGVTDITPLAGLYALNCLAVGDNRIADISALAGLTHLTELWIAGNPVTDHSPIEGIYTQLEGRDFEYGDTYLAPEDPGTVVVFADPLFENLVRERIRIPDGDITAADAARVTRLDFNMDWQENIPDDIRIHDLTGIEYFINLKELSMNFHAVSDIGMLPALPRLESLDLGANGYSDLSVFISMPNLRRLVLFGNGIGDIAPLAGLTKLTYLQLEHNQIADISALAGMAELRTLDVQDNQIADFSPLYGLETLETLRINYNATQDASGLKDMAERLQDKDFDPDQKLEQGNGGGSDRLQPENPDKVIAFADPVFEKRVRQELNMPEGDITAGMAAQVDNLNLGNEWQETFPKGSQYAKLNGIQYFINLRSLTIAWNKVEDISKLAKLTRLEYLHAYGNRISDITPLAGLTNLVNLNIGGNKVKKIGALSGLVNLQELYLDGNAIKNYSPIQEIYPRLQHADFKLE